MTDNVAAMDFAGWTMTDDVAAINFAGVDNDG